MSLKLRTRNHPRMFQWDAVDTSPDSWDQNVLKTFEMAIRHNRQTTRTELERACCRWIYFNLRLKLFSGRLTGSDRPIGHCRQRLVASCLASR